MSMMIYPLRRFSLFSSLRNTYANYLLSNWAVVSLKVTFGNLIQAQAIMLLAGNGSPISSNIAQPKVQLQATSPKPAAADVSPVKQPITTPPGSRLSSPLSASSHSGTQSGSGSTGTEEIVAAKTTGVATTPVSKLEPPKLASAMGSVDATTMIPSGMTMYS